MRFHWLFQLSTWIEQTALSQFIQNTSWIVPAVQTVHILAIAAVLSSATMVACRFAGWGGRDQPPRQFVARYLPSIADNMDELETMLEPGAKFETAEAREHANLISVMMLAFPHMFPPATNQWKDGASRDAALDTYASPDVWKTFADFYARSTTASQTALEASKAKTFKEFKARIAELRTSCDGCHAAYMKVDK